MAKLRIRGEGFESDVHCALNTVMVAYYFLISDEHDDLTVLDRDSCVLSLLESIADELEDVITNYHMRIKEEPTEELKA
jgi:hypothetical protein